MPTIESAGGYVVDVRPYGPSTEEIEDLRNLLVAEGPIAEMLDGARHRWLSFHVVPGVSKKSAVLAPPKAFTGTLYDYTNDRAIGVVGPLDDPLGVVGQVSDRQPIPTLAEFREAVAIVHDDPKWGPLLRAGEIEAYRPMPPLFEGTGSDGRSRRIVAVGLHAVDPPDRRSSAVEELFGDDFHRRVGVDLSQQQMGPQEIPPDDEPCNCLGDCGAPVKDDQCDETGDVGQVELTVTAPDGSEIWRLLAIRPAATEAPPSGGILIEALEKLLGVPQDETVSTNGCGVELMHMFYRDEQALHQAHVPILNVEYQGVDPCCNCGPSYRDWLHEEACFEAIGEDVMPGIRLCTQRPRTMIEAGFDGGNFRGMAIFFDGNDLMLTSELQAGWYRYMTEWQLAPNGTIRPRFGFSAVKNACTCQSHTHHAYWRFDFDVDGIFNRVEEFNENDPVLGTGWTPLPVEVSRFRNPETNRHWKVSESTSPLTSTDQHYLIRPGPEDGTADLYGGADVWFLAYNEHEIDDGQGFTEDRALSRERIDLFMDGEVIDDEDLVVWYGVHFSHEAEDLEEEGEVGEFVGPDLICSWAEDIPDPTTTTTTSTTSTTSTTTTTSPSTTTTTTPGGGGGGGGGAGGGGGSGGPGGGGGSGGGGGGGGGS